MFNKLFNFFEYELEIKDIIIKNVNYLSYDLPILHLYITVILKNKFKNYKVKFRFNYNLKYKDYDIFLISVNNIKEEELDSTFYFEIKKLLANKIKNNEIFWKEIKKISNDIE